MSEDRWSGGALITGSAGFIITMAMHPTGRDLFVPGRAAAMAQMAAVVHGLALACLPLMFFGALGLIRRLRNPRGLPLLGLVAYGFTLVAVMIAAVMSGFIAADLGRRIAESVAPAPETLTTLFQFAGQMNQAFARVYVAGAAVAILAWSIAMAREKIFARGAGIYGCILAPITLLALFSGHLGLDVRGFGIVVLTQAIWFIAVGAKLWNLHSSEAQGQA